MEKLTIASAKLSALIERINSVMSWKDYPTKENFDAARQVMDILHDAKFQTKHLFDTFDGYSLDVHSILDHMENYKGQCSAVEMVFILAYNINDRAEFDGRISAKQAEKSAAIMREITENARKNIQHNCLCGELSSGLIDMLFKYIEIKEAE